SPDRYAVQLTVRGDGPEPALIESIHRWRLAVAGAGLPPWPLVRAEVKTPAELEAENQAEAAPLLPATMSVTVDAEALEAAYQATRALLGATSDHDARVIIATLIYRLGGAVVPASRRPPDAVPLDLGVGPGEGAVAAEGHDAGDPTLVGPAVDGLRRHVQQAGHFSRRQELLGVRSGQGLGLLGLANVDIIDKTARFHNDLGLPTGNLSDFSLSSVSTG